MDKKLILSILFLVAVGSLLIYTVSNSPTPTSPENLGNQSGQSGEMKKFSSTTELARFLAQSSQQGGFFEDMMMTKSVAAPMMATTEAAKSSGQDATLGGAGSYSTTNVQVEGVDEADIVKTDGNYIYVLSGTTLSIIKATPAADAKVISKIELRGSPSEIFIKGDKLAVFGNHYDYEAANSENSRLSSLPIRVFQPRNYQFAYIEVYDTSYKSDPEKVKDISVSGNYKTSRMIGNNIYMIAEMYASYGPIIMPMVRENGVENKMLASDIYYFPYPDYSYNYLNIISLDISDDDSKHKSKTILAGSSQNVYVSGNNIYLAGTKYNYFYSPLPLLEEVIIPALPDEVAGRAREANSQSEVQEIIIEYTSGLDEGEKKALSTKIESLMTKYDEKMALEKEKTLIHKIAITSGEMDYKGMGSIPGTVLNQFSMDEHKGYLRVATTLSEDWGVRGEQRQMSKNNVYILDSDMKLSGSIIDLAPGERIYSARFMGNRAYLVTFKKVDPLFVLDLKDPADPQLLGKLKIPGYSDYLHPYDENHIIGIGKEAVLAKEGDFAWYQGVKIALFDVSDPSNPKEKAKFNIGDRGTDSYALSDHKAFLFDKEKQLLVIPVLLAEIDKSKYAGELPEHAYGEYTFQGAYVLKASLDGFELKGRITHVVDDSLRKSGYYYGDQASVKRSLYIGNTLYTVSDSMVKANDLETLKEIKSVSLPKSEQKPGFDGSWIDVMPRTIQ